MHKLPKNVLGGILSSLDQRGYLGIHSMVQDPAESGIPAHSSHLEANWESTKGYMDYKTNCAE